MCIRDSPEGDVHEVRSPERLQQPVERVVAVFDLPFFATDERKAFQMPGQQVVAIPRVDDRCRDVRRERDELADGSILSLIHF